MGKFQRHYIITLLSVVAIVSMVACSSNNCPLDNTVNCNYHFYDSEGNAISLSDTLTISVLLPGYDTLYTYRLTGSPTITSKRPMSQLVDNGYRETVSITRHDSIILNRIPNASKLSLPMAYHNQGDTLIFNYSSLSRNDTIYIAHDNFPQVNLPECGTYMFHRITGAKSTDTSIERIEISNPNVNYEGKENIKIYFMGTLE